MSALTARPKLLHGAVLFEQIVLLLLILVLFWITLIRVWELRHIAEQTHVETIIGSLRSTIGIEVSHRILRQGMDAVAAMENSNPIQYLAHPPPNYLGELGQPEAEEVEGYQWYFDRREKALVYRINHPEQFSTSLPGVARIRLAIKLDYTDVNNNGRFDSPTDHLQSIRLVPLEPFRWIKTTKD